MSYNGKESNLNLSCLALIIGFVGISKLIKFSYVVGSLQCYFSAVSITGPLAMVFGGPLGEALFLILNYLFSTKSVMLLASSGVPNIFAGLYWTTKSEKLRIILPILCMVLFWANPIGTAAWPYAMFWLIPAIIGMMKTKNIFLTALGSTFMAHAVGSVIWLYVMPMSAGQWLALMPIVPIERVCFASAMVCVYSALKFVSKHRFGTVAAIKALRDA
jgi:hypothetical protein